MVTAIPETKEDLKKLLHTEIDRLDSDQLLEIRNLLAKMSALRLQEEADRLWDAGILSPEKIDAAVKKYRANKKKRS